MENYSKYYLSLLMIFSLVSCFELSNERYNNLDPNEGRKLSDHYVSLANMRESGSTKNMRLLEKAARINPKNEQAFRELAYPYLYAGIYEKWNEFNQKAIELNPKAWQSQRGHTKLFYFRDYGGALSDFEFADTLTTDANDYVQNKSIEYLKGLCYLGLKNYSSAEECIAKYIKTETTKSGSQFIDQAAYIYLAIIKLHYQNYENALEILDDALKFPTPLSDSYYYKAKAHFMLGEINQAKKAIIEAKLKFDEEEYNKAIYYEVPYQIYLYDIEMLEKEIACFL